MDLSTYLNQFLFGYYPYVCLVVFFVGSLIRFDREQYTWKSDSSQFLRHGQLRWASNLFHIGVLGIFGGHLTGFLTPVVVWHAIGVSLPEKQMTAMVAGGVFGAMCAIGLGMLLARRLGDPRILTVADGPRPCSCCSPRPCSAWRHPDRRSIPTARSCSSLLGAAHRHLPRRGGVAGGRWSIVFKLHMVLGLTLFLVQSRAWYTSERFRLGTYRSGLISDAQPRRRALIQSFARAVEDPGRGILGQVVDDPPPIGLDK